jgi:hypothetical protein
MFMKRTVFTLALALMMSAGWANDDKKSKKAACCADKEAKTCSPSKSKTACCKEANRADEKTAKVDKKVTSKKA